jgi:tetratricopeptide (TPR) repeat protein
LNKPLNPEDYAEPRCLLGDERFGAAAVIPVPQQRIIGKLDEYLSRRDYEGAEKHLKYWLEEARQGRDDRGRLLILNELVGHCRKTGRREDAFRYAEEALALMTALGYEGSVTGGTTRVNAATAYSAFGENEKALALFEKAGADYAGPGTDPDLLGGLYNNMALACKALGRFDEAFSLFEKAIGMMGRIPGGQLEQAITCLNMADTVSAQQGPEKGRERIRTLVQRAADLLQNPEVPRDGYYAFVCEKCAPGFDDYGFPEEAEALRQAAREIYERA